MNLEEIKKLIDIYYDNVNLYGKLESLNIDVCIPVKIGDKLSLININKIYAGAGKILLVPEEELTQSNMPLENTKSTVEILDKVVEEDKKIDERISVAEKIKFNRKRGRPKEKNKPEIEF